MGLLFTFPAAAAKGEKRFSAATHYLFLAAQEAPQGHKHSAGLTLGFGYGLLDNLNLLVDLDYQFFFKSRNRFHAAQLNLLAAWTIDAVRWVIEVPVGLGFRNHWIDGKHHVEGQLVSGVTIDYRPARRWSVGLTIRLGINLVNFDAFPATVAVGFRCATYWE